MSNYPYHSKLSAHEDDYTRYIAGVSDVEEYEEFVGEGQEICLKLGEIGVQSELLLDADIDDVADVIRNPAVSDLIFIGHGSLSDMYLYGAKGDRFD